MTRETSFIAYNQIKEEGLLTELRFLVYEAIYQHGPISTTEAAEIIDIDSKSVSPRMVELKRLGVVEEKGKKICTITNRLVIAWAVTDRLPVKHDKPMKIKCKHCNGRGYDEVTQTKLF